MAYTRDGADRVVARSTTGTPGVRYGYAGPGDTPDLVMDTTGKVAGREVSLPGGVLLSTDLAAGTETWSYPNVHGDVMATADATGAKIGATVVYDPYGNLAAGDYPENSPRNYDYAWLGRCQRPTDHALPLAVLEMGARPYLPATGRFLQVDPVPGGSCNAYDYACADPVNGLDLDGTKRRHRGWFSFNLRLGDFGLGLGVGPTHVSAAVRAPNPVRVVRSTGRAVAKATRATGRWVVERSRDWKAGWGVAKENPYACLWAVATCAGAVVAAATGVGASLVVIAGTGCVASIGITGGR